MKQFRIIFSTFVAFCMLSTAIVFNACNADPCKDISCKNGGVCRDGSCKCSDGFEGPFCTVKMYEKFVGVFDGYYRCNGLIPETKAFIISPDSKPNRILLYNLFAQNEAIMGTVDVEKVVFDSLQVGQVIYSGNGYIYDLDISLFIQEYHLDDSTLHTCTFNGRKFLN